MMPPDSMYFLQQQRHREMLQRAVRRTPDSGERAFQRLSWWFGRALLSLGCALQQAARVAPLPKKGCCVCLP